MKRVTRILGRAQGDGTVNESDVTKCRGSRREISRRRERSERGSSLILALVYIVSVSLIVGALADWAMDDLKNTTHFQSAASIDNAVSGATEIAIQSMRYYPQYPATQSPTVASNLGHLC